MECYNPETYTEHNEESSDALTIIFICLFLFTTYLCSVFNDPFDDN